MRGFLLGAALGVAVGAVGGVLVARGVPHGDPSNAAPSATPQDGAPPAPDADATRADEAAQPRRRPSGEDARDAAPTAAPPSAARGVSRAELLGELRRVVATDAVDDDAVRLATLAASAGSATSADAELVLALLRVSGRGGFAARRAAASLAQQLRAEDAERLLRLALADAPEAAALRSLADSLGTAVARDAERATGLWRDLVDHGDTDLALAGLRLCALQPDFPARELEALLHSGRDTRVRQGALRHAIFRLDDVTSRDAATRLVLDAVGADDVELRREALDALPQLGAAGAAAALAALRGGGLDADERARALDALLAADRLAEALPHLAGSDGARALAAWLIDADTEDPRRLAPLAPELRRIADATSRADEVLWVAAQCGLAEEVARIGAQADAPRDTRAGALYALLSCAADSDLPDPDACARLAADLGDTLLSPEHADPELRRRAAALIGENGDALSDQGAVATLRSALARAVRGDVNAWVRAAAAEALGRLDPGESGAR